MKRILIASVFLLLVVNIKAQDGVFQCVIAPGGAINNDPYGPELVSNSTVDINATGWTLTSGTETSTGARNTTTPITGAGDYKATVSVGGSQTSRPKIDIALSSALTIGKTYHITFNTKVVSGTIVLHIYNLGSGNITVDEVYSGSQNWTYDITCNSANSAITLFFNGTVTWVLQLDNVSVKEIL